MRRVSAAAFVSLLSAGSISTLHAQDVDANGAGAGCRRDRQHRGVLGTARENTTELTSTAPVDVITPEQLRETGAVTINQALSKLHPPLQFSARSKRREGAGRARGVAARRRSGVHAGARQRQAPSTSSAQLSGTDPWPAAQVVDINTIPVNAIRARRSAARRCAPHSTAPTRLPASSTSSCKDSVGGVSDGGRTAAIATAAVTRRCWANGWS